MLQPKYWSFSFSIILPKKSQGSSPSEWTGWISLQSKGHEREEKGPREKASLFSGLFQRVVTVCFEMGVPYFKVRGCMRLKA